MKLYYIFFLPFVYCFNIKKFVGTSLLGSSLFFNNIQPSIAYPQQPPIINQNTGNSAKILIERNNIYFYGSVTPQSCEELKNKLNEMNYNGRLFKIGYHSDPPPINLHIQSGGGSLLNSLYIVDLIESSETPVHTYVDGYSASAASLLSVVGNKRYMTKNSMILVHQLSSENQGKFQELDDDMKNLQQLMDKVKKIYLMHSNLQYLQLDELLQHDLWLDAETCKKYGLVDEII